MSSDSDDTNDSDVVVVEAGALVFCVIICDRIPIILQKC